MSENNVRTLYVYMASKRKKSSIDEEQQHMLNERQSATLAYFIIEIGNQAISETKPTLLILCGPPGSGKSTIKSVILADRGINAFVVDPDEIRTKLLQGVKKDIRYEDLSKIVNELAETIMNKAIEAKINIVFDTTGRNFGAIPNLLKNSVVKNKYHTIFSVVWASREACLARVDQRNAKLKSARETDANVRIELPSEEAGKIYDDFVKSKNGIASNLLLGYKPAKSERRNAPISVDEILLYDNDSDTKLLFHKIGKDVIIPVIGKNGFYDMNITEESPYISLAPSLEEEPESKKQKTTSHGAGKTKKKHKHKRRNTRNIKN